MFRSTRKIEDDRQRAAIGAVDRFAQQHHQQLEPEDEADAPDEPVSSEQFTHG